MQRRAGFTLIELMIVIAIIAIIAAIAIPNLIEARKAANEAAVIGSMRTVVSAQLQFRDGDLDMDQTPDYGTIAQLGVANLIDAPLINRVKHGYYFMDDLSGGNYALTAVPASAHTGRRNLRLTCGSDPPGDCEIRASSSGIPGGTSPLVPNTEGEPADPVPPASSGMPCAIAPAALVPMTPEVQATAEAAVQAFLQDSAVSLAQSYGASVADLAQVLFATSSGASVAPDQAVLASLDSDNDQKLDLGEITAASVGQFSAANTIAGVQNAYGSCEALCAAAGDASCETSCGASIAPPGNVEFSLDILALGLVFLLDIGTLCEETLPALPLSELSGDPLAFVAAAFGFGPQVPLLGPQVPLLVPPLLGALAFALFVAGLRRARTHRSPPPHS